MKNKTLAWAIKQTDGSLLCVCWTKDEAENLKVTGEKIIRVQIREVLRKRR